MQPARKLTKQTVLIALTAALTEESEAYIARGYGRPHKKKKRGNGGVEERANLII